MKNKIKDNEYSDQMRKAQEFLNEHDGDNKLIILFSDLKNSKKLHSMNVIIYIENKKGVW